MSLEESFLQMRVSLLSSRDGGDAVRRAAVLAERVLKGALEMDENARAGLGEMIGAVYRDEQLRARFGRELVKRLNWLNELRKRSVHDKGGVLEEVSVDDGQRAVEVVSDTLLAVDAFSREELDELRREADWRASSGPSETVLTLDRVRQRDDFEGLISRPRRLIALAVHGEAGQGHEHFAQVMNWRLQSSPTGRWTEVPVDWPAPSAALGVRLGSLLEALALALDVEVTLPYDRDPSSAAATDREAWDEALEPVWRSLERSRKRHYMRHVISVVTGHDAGLVARYLEVFWSPAAARMRERAVLSFELMRAETAGVPLLTRSWRVSRAEKRASERIVAALEGLDLPGDCRTRALDELTSVSEDDLTRWLRNEHGASRTDAENLAKEVISATRGGRFELVVRRIEALTREHGRQPYRRAARAGKARPERDGQRRAAT